MPDQDAWGMAQIKIPNWHRWWCRWRGYHLVKQVAVDLETNLAIESTPPIILVRRRCWCGSTASPHLVGDPRKPGGFIEYKPDWPYGGAQ